MDNIEYIKHDEGLLAIIIYSQYNSSGVSFFTPSNHSQQLAYMNHDRGKVIEAHVHNHVVRQVHYTNEVLMIKNGRLRVDFYTSEKEYTTSRMLNKGDVILLSDGGHGFEVIEDIEMIEVKQGPHLGEQDKTRFKSVSLDKIKFT